ncbi:MAG: radical SAM family heme chaperone HemW [Pirellulaceae bacterium]
MTPPRGAYLHVPFCTHRCGYCNFTLVAGRGDLVPAYLEALELELSRLDGPCEVDTLFIGGGTPTFLDATQLAQLLKLATDQFPLAAGHEFSVEANPADITAEKVAVLADHGVNRVSLGVQSFRAEKLKILERDHRREEVQQAIEQVVRRIDNLSLDLIFATPGETLDQWQADLDEALKAPIRHLSTYGLTYEQGTAFWSRLRRAELSEADEELQRAMYLTAIDTITAAGHRQYEISNFAQPGYACRHNERYWLGESFHAAGPGAARFLEGVRETNHRSTTTYIKKVLAGESPIAERDALTPEQRARERLVFGLRRVEGIDIERFAAEVGFSVENLAAKEIENFVTWGLIEREGNQLRLTREGLLLSDSVAVALL